MGSSSSSKRAKSIYSIASFLFFFIIIFQIPLFRVPCSSGICITPVQITSSQIITTEILPITFVKSLLYPGAILNALIKGNDIPKYDDVLEIYNLSHVKHTPAVIHLRRLEILIGSYLCVAGSILGLIKHDRVSLFGMLLLQWGLIKEILTGSKTVEVSPFMLIATLIAFFCIKSDVKQIITSSQDDSYATTTSILEELIRKRRKEREMKRLEWTINYIGPRIPRSTKIAQTGITNTFES